MSQIDEVAANAFWKPEAYFKNGETSVSVLANWAYLRLYESIIAYRYPVTQPHHVFMQTHGFNTATTRARLKAIFMYKGHLKSVYVSNGKLQLFGREWTGKDVKLDLRNPTKWEYV